MISFAQLKHQLGELETHQQNIDFYLKEIERSRNKSIELYDAIKETVIEYEKLQERNKRIDDESIKSVLHATLEPTLQEGTKEPVEEPTGL